VSAARKSPQTLYWQILLSPPVLVYGIIVHPPLVVYTWDIPCDSIDICGSSADTEQYESPMVNILRIFHEKNDRKPAAIVTLRIGPPVSDGDCKPAQTTLRGELLHNLLRKYGTEAEDTVFHTAKACNSWEPCLRVPGITLLSTLLDTLTALTTRLRFYLL
jgi:hypothetical protein